MNGVEIIKRFSNKVRRIFFTYKRIYTSVKDIFAYLPIYESYLVNGRYRIKFFEAGRPFIVTDNEYSLKFYNGKMPMADILNTKNLNQILSYIEKFIKIKIATIVFSNFYDLKFDKEKNFNGSILTIAGNKNIKIFDLKDKIIVTFFSDLRAYRLTKKASVAFSEHFNVTMISFNDEKKSCYERCIDYKPYKEWSYRDKEGALKEIIFCYSNYFRKIEKNEVIYRSVKDIINNFEKNDYVQPSLLNMIKDIVSNYQSHEFMPYIYMHGDTHNMNILLCEKTYYFIDWESSRECIFFHDIIYFIITSYEAEHIFLDNYFRGDYDSDFIELFKIFSIKYECENKLYYIALFFIEHISSLCESFSHDQNKLRLVLKNKEQIIFDIIKEYI